LLDRKNWREWLAAIISFALEAAVFDDAVRGVAPNAPAITRDFLVVYSRDMPWAVNQLQVSSALDFAFTSPSSNFG
jgi:hypothetical protein